MATQWVSPRVAPACPQAVYRPVCATDTPACICADHVCSPPGVSPTCVPGCDSTATGYRSYGPDHLKRMLELHIERARKAAPCTCCTYPDWYVPFSPGLSKLMPSNFQAHHCSDYQATPPPPPPPPSVAVCSTMRCFKMLQCGRGACHPRSKPSTTLRTSSGGGSARGAHQASVKHGGLTGCFSRDSDSARRKYRC